nr:hypothetical protein [Fodinicola feengrottensis]
MNVSKAVCSPMLKGLRRLVGAAGEVSTDHPLHVDPADGGPGRPLDRRELFGQAGCLQHLGGAQPEPKRPGMDRHAVAPLDYCRSDALAGQEQGGRQADAAAAHDQDRGGFAVHTSSTGYAVLCCVHRTQWWRWRLGDFRTSPRTDQRREHTQYGGCQRAGPAVPAAVAAVGSDVVVEKICGHGELQELGREKAHSCTPTNE